MTDTYRNAFTEVYEIISYLKDVEYNKIPKNIIKKIEKNRNTEYEFLIDETKSLDEQDILPETRAILFNLYRDYFATPKQKEQMINFQLSETYRLEEEKKANYNDKNDKVYNNTNNIKSEKIENINKNNKAIKTSEQETSLVEIKKVGMFSKMFRFIKNIFKSKK